MALDARMSGLLADEEEEPRPRAPETESPAEDMGAPDEGEDGEEQPNVTPEEQAQYDQFVDNAFSLIYDKRSLPNVLKALDGDGNFVDGLAHTTVTIVARVLDSAKQAGQKISGDVVLHGGKEIMEDLADTAGKAGIHDYTQDEIDAAFLRAMDLARERFTQAGDVDTEALKTEFAAVIAADRQGRLEEFVPGAEAFAGRKTDEADEEEEAA